MDRTYDIVMFGASGFAGKLTAEYLQKNHGDLKLAIAGRSKGKLEALGLDLPIVVADSSDPASLKAMAESTRVVCTSVGPYAKYGAPLVEACVASGTHYCDLTGEPQFVRKMIDTHHEAAKAAGVRIVHCCGFDSIPSDLGTYFLQMQGDPCERVEMVVKAAKGGASGGTIASLSNVIAEASNPEVRRAIGDPYSLSGGHRGPDGTEQRGIRKSDAAGTWTAPFLMAGINEKVVRRSNALLGLPYGTDFSYGESMKMGSGVRGFVRALTVTGAFGSAVSLLALPPTRRFLHRFVLPKPGEGPSEEAVKTGFFVFDFYGLDGDRVVRKAKVTGQGDPGYGATAVMLGLSAVTLACDELDTAGVLTPAAAMGDALLKRFEGSAITFEAI